MFTIDMSEGYNEVAAWYALARLVEQQGEEGERCLMVDLMNEAKGEGEKHE